MIVAPVESVDRAVFRAVLEAGAQFTPVTAALTRLYQTTHPSKFQRELAEWQITVSSSANDHEARLQRLEETYHPRLTLSEDAQALAIWLAGQSITGDEANIAFATLRQAFPTRPKHDLQDAVAELKLAGLATVMAVFGDPIYEVAPTFDLFALLDPVVTKTSPQDDAVELARQALALGAGRVPEIAQRLEWSPRRINPALALLLPMVSMVSQTRDALYLTPWFNVGAEERVTFRRLIEGAERAKPLA